MQTLHLLPSKYGVTAGQSTHFFNVGSNTPPFSQKEQVFDVELKYLGTKQSMQFLLSQNLLAGH